MIIAEISQNFTNIEEAEILTDLAVQNGADLVKAQLFDSIKLYGKHVPAELSFDDAKHLFEYGKSVGIEVFFSVFDVERVKWCEQIGVKRYKIACGYHLHFNLLDTIKKTKKPIFASIYMDELPHYAFKRKYKIKWLFCIPSYPAPMDEVKYAIFYHHHNGFSDHTIGLDASKIALARGARIIEKHFALDHHTGVDAEWSMDCNELRELKRFENICKEIL